MIKLLSNLYKTLGLIFRIHIHTNIHTHIHTKKKAFINQVWWQIPIIPALERLKHKELKTNPSLGYCSDLNENAPISS